MSYRHIKLNSFKTEYHPLCLRSSPRRNRIWDRYLWADLLRSALGCSTWRPVREAGLGTGRSWSVLQTQQEPQLIFKGALGLEWPFRVFLNWEKETQSLCPYINQSLNMGFTWQWGVPLSKVAPFGQRGLLHEPSAAFTREGWGNDGFHLEHGTPSCSIHWKLSPCFLCLPSTQTPKFLASSCPGLLYTPYHFHIW